MGDRGAVGRDETARYRHALSHDVRGSGAGGRPSRDRHSARPCHGSLTVPFALLWLAAPAVAQWISRPRRAALKPSFAPKNSSACALIARRTWRYFETFVTAADNFLPPDNFQETPRPAVAHRTSPTNIGLYLLSVTVARDMGWIGTAAAAARLEETLQTIERMPRFRGHLYNWYDTRDLRVLDPPYVSSVDSGNLAGHLIAVAQACRDWADAPQSEDTQRAGLPIRWRSHGRRWPEVRTPRSATSLTRWHMCCRSAPLQRDRLQTLAARSGRPMSPCLPRATSGGSGSLR